MSSPELQVDPILALLVGKSAVVTSVLLTSTGSLGSQPVMELFGKTAKLNVMLRIAGGTPVQRVKQGWSAVRKWKKSVVKPCALRVRHEVCL